jgi:hypothetical protein
LDLVLGFWSAAFCKEVNLFFELNWIWYLVFGLQLLCPVRDGAAALPLPLLFSRDHVREKAKEAVG